MDDRDEMRELLRSVLDVREWLARLDTKLDYMSDVKDTAESAQETARQAKSQAEENARDIAEMKANAKWLWGIVLSTAGSLVVGLIVFFVTK